MEKVCCFCGKPLGKWGNNPWPACIDEDAECCDDCNISIVIPARIENMIVNRKGE